MKSVYFLSDNIDTLLTDGVCQCDPNYGSRDCSIDKTIPPKVATIQGNGKCDRKDKTCSNLRFTVDGCLTDVECKIVHVEVMLRVFVCVHNFVSYYIRLTDKLMTYVIDKLYYLCTKQTHVKCDGIQWVSMVYAVHLKLLLLYL